LALLQQVAELRPALPGLVVEAGGLLGLAAGLGEDRPGGERGVAVAGRGGAGGLEQLLRQGRPAGGDAQPGQVGEVLRAVPVAAAVGAVVRDHLVGELHDLVPVAEVEQRAEAGGAQPGGGLGEARCWANPVPARTVSSAAAGPSPTQTGSTMLL